jgi:hypothetical protein
MSGRVTVRQMFRPCVSCEKNRVIRKLQRTESPLLHRVGVLRSGNRIGAGQPGSSDIGPQRDTERGEMGIGARGAPIPEVGLYMKIKRVQFRNSGSHPNEGHVNSP